MICSIAILTHLAIYNYIVIKGEIKANKANKAVLSQINNAKTRIFEALRNMQQADDILHERFKQLDRELKRHKENRL